MKTALDVLLVEDDIEVREAVARALRSEDLTVEVAADVAGAVARLRHTQHSIVLCDLMLPGFSGFDLLDRVAGDRPHVPVVLITGYATIENALQAFKRGAFDFLPKPFDVAELLGVVRRALFCRAHRRWNAFSPVGELSVTDPDASPERMHFLGQHSWVAVDERGATFGVAESFAGCLAEIRSVRLPEPGDSLVQGLAFAEISTADSAVHRVWAPLSGTVTASNPEVASDPDLLNRSPFSSGWLARVALTTPEEQLDALTHRTGGRAVPSTGGGWKENRWSS